jgi:mRNA interferase MazF
MTSSIVTSSPVFKPWDVVVVPFPYSERLAEKRRPALVVSSAKLHRLGFLWLVMITGAAKQRRLGDIVISDLQAAGLPGVSMARTSKVATVEPARVLRRIGAIAKPERTGLAQSIRGFLAAP